MVNVHRRMLPAGSFVDVGYKLSHQHVDCQLKIAKTLRHRCWLLFHCSSLLFAQLQDTQSRIILCKLLLFFTVHLYARAHRIFTRVHTWPTRGYYYYRTPHRWMDVGWMLNDVGWMLDGCSVDVG
jgi:hypothetical protein